MAGPLFDRIGRIVAPRTPPDPEEVRAIIRRYLRARMSDEDIIIRLRPLLAPAGFVREMLMKEKHRLASIRPRRSQTRAKSK